MKNYLNRTSFRLMPFYITLYMVLCVYQNFFTVYLNDIGVDSRTIGILMALAPLASLLGQPVWGNIGDRVRYKNSLLLLLCFAAAAMSVLLSLSANVFLIGAFLALFAFFYMSVQPVGDAVTLEALERDQMPFGPVRITASLSFALLSGMSGLFLTGHSERVPWVTALLLLLTGLCVLAMPRISGHRKKSDRSGMRELFRYKHMMMVFLLSGCIMIGMVFFYNFFSIYYKEDLGGTQSMLGICYFISAFVELPFLLASDRLYQKFGVVRILLFSGTIMGLRWLILAAVHSPWTAMASQVLHSCCFLMMSFTVIKYVNESVPPQYKAAGQMLYTLFTLSIARVAGALIGGEIAQYFGRRTMFLIGGIYTLLCVVLFGIYFVRHWREYRPGS